MKDHIFLSLSFLIAFTGVLIPGLIAQEIISERYMVLSLFAVAAVFYIAVITIKDMPKRLGS